MGVVDPSEKHVGWESVHFEIRVAGKTKMEFEVEVKRMQMAKKKTKRVSPTCRAVRSNLGDVLVVPFFVCRVDGILVCRRIFIYVACFVTDDRSD